MDFLLHYITNLYTTADFFFYPHSTLMLNNIKLLFTAAPLVKEQKKKKKTYKILFNILITEFF